jgi:hypothetical protein
MKIELVKGTTYKDVLRWASPECVFKPITAITNAAPAVITCPEHGLVDGWTVTFESVAGMREINEMRHQVEVIDPDTFSIPCLNSLGFKTYAVPAEGSTNGVIRYLAPVDLTDFEARMRIRPGGSNDPLTWIELKSDVDGPVTDFPLITLDATTATISRLIPIALSDTFEWTQATYTLKLFRFVGTEQEESIKVDSGTITIK